MPAPDWPGRASAAAERERKRGTVGRHSSLVESRESYVSIYHRIASRSHLDCFTLLCASSEKLRRINCKFCVSQSVSFVAIATPSIYPGRNSYSSLRELRRIATRSSACARSTASTQHQQIPRTVSYFHPFVKPFDEKRLLIPFSSR